MAQLLDDVHQSDEHLVEAFQRGDAAAFHELVRRESRWVRGAIYAVLGRRDLVDDVFQEVWLAVWQRAATLEDPRRWRTWLYRLSRNAAIDAARRGRNRGRFLERCKERLPVIQRRREPPPPENGLVLAEETQRIARAIEGLPPIYRGAFVLRHVEDWSCQAIAEVLEVPVDTVETRLVRARRLLRQALRIE